LVFPQETGNVSTAVQYVENQHSGRLYSIQHDEFADRYTAQAGSQVNVSTPACVRIGIKQQKALCDCANEAVCNVGIRATLRDVIPDLVEVSTGLRSNVDHGYCLDKRLRPRR
jgi:hypothetical protein